MRDALEDIRLLIVQPFLYTLSGSEIICLELAARMSLEGAQVAIVTWGWSDDLAAEVATIPGVQLFDLGSQGFEQYLDSRTPDLVWVHQGLVPRQLLEKPTSRFVFAHLSAFNSFERPFVPQVEQALADAVFFVSPETEGMFDELGLLPGIPPEKKHLLSNPAPDAFHQVEPVDAPLGSILLVSNHIPAELIEATTLMRGQGLDVTVVGSAQEGIDSAPQRVTADLISQHDCVISIGKTVQYALCAGRPVYCYDYFGGPGWLQPDNYDRALHYNFSGRGFGKKTAEIIVGEVTSQFESAREFATEQVAEARRLFSYDRVIDVLADLLDGAPSPHEAVAPQVVDGFVAAHETVGSFGVSHHVLTGLYAATKTHASNLEAIIAAQQEQLASLEDANREKTAHVRHLEQVVADAHGHIAARRPSARLRRAKDRAVSAARKILGQS